MEVATRLPRSVLCYLLAPFNHKVTMHQNQLENCLLLFLILLVVAPRVAAQQACFTSQERARAEQTAKVYRAPDPSYDPVLGYNPARGPRRGAPSVDENGLATPFNCVANKDTSPGAG